MKSLYRGSDCNTGQFFGPGGVIAVISSFFPIFHVPGVIAVISLTDFQSAWCYSGHFAKFEKLLKTSRKGVFQKILCSFFKYSTIIDRNLYFINVAGLPEIL